MQTCSQPGALVPFIEVDGVRRGPPRRRRALSMRYLSSKSGGHNGCHRKSFPRAFPSNSVQADCIKELVILSAACLFVWLLLASYGVDLSLGFF